VLLLSCLCIAHIGFSPRDQKFLQYFLAFRFVGRKQAPLPPWSPVSFYLHSVTSGIWVEEWQEHQEQLEELSPVPPTPGPLVGVLGPPRTQFCEGGAPIFSKARQSSRAVGGRQGGRLRAAPLSSELTITTPAPTLGGAPRRALGPGPPELSLASVPRFWWSLNTEVRGCRLQGDPAPSCHARSSGVHLFYIFT
jgi:hypothetical protein